MPNHRRALNRYQQPYSSMHISLLIAVPFLLISALALGQSKEYKLISKTNNADINQRAILHINTVKTIAATRNAFKPTKGNHTVYVFIATFKGHSYNNTEKEFHDILILKTSKKQKILEAYQYTLEWAEMPLTYDLYKASAKEVILRNGLSIEKLKFRKIESTEGINNDLDEQGVLTY